MKAIWQWQFREFCQKIKIKNYYSFPIHPQTNRQVETANRVIKRILDVKLDKAKGVKQILKVKLEKTKRV